MKLIKTLENKPRAPATLIDMLIGGQGLLTHCRMFIWPQGCCSQTLHIDDGVWMNKGKSPCHTHSHTRARTHTHTAGEVSKACGPHRAAEFWCRGHSLLREAGRMAGGQQAALVCSAQFRVTELSRGGKKNRRPRNSQNISPLPHRFHTANHLSDHWADFCCCYFRPVRPILRPLATCGYEDVACANRAVL